MTDYFYIMIFIISLLVLWLGITLVSSGGWAMVVVGAILVIFSGVYVLVRID
jgi:hypothetical protein